MVARVPLLGMLIAMSLLLVENLGANAYIAAKQRRVAQVSEKAAPVSEYDRMRDPRVIAQMRRLLEEIKAREHDIVSMRPHLTESDLDRVRLELDAKLVELDRLHQQLAR